MTFRSVKDFNDAQIRLIKSRENRWFTGEEVHHEPSSWELVVHWISSGAAAKFAADNKVEKKTK